MGQEAADNPLVSIVIPTYNYSTYVMTAIQSCLDQTYPNIEIIVGDDGSTDKTRELVEKNFGEKVMYIFQENSGVSAARNKGMHQARGEFLTFLDADDYLTPESIELRMDIFRRYPDIGIVVGESYTKNAGGDKLSYRPRQKADIVGKRFHEDLLLKRLAFATCTALVRSSLAKQVEFPPHISNGEDIAYFTRIFFSTDGYYLARPTAVIVHHPDSQRYNIEKIKKQNLDLVRTIFDDPFYNNALAHLRREFTSARFLSLSRSLFLAGERTLSRQYYLAGIAAKPSNVLKLNYLTKFLRSWF